MGQDERPLVVVGPWRDVGQRLTADAREDAQEQIEQVVQRGLGGPLRERRAGLDPRVPLPQPDLRAAREQAPDPVVDVHRGPLQHAAIDAGEQLEVALAPVVAARLVGVERQQHAAVVGSPDRPEPFPVRAAHSHLTRPRPPVPGQQDGGVVVVEDPSEDRDPPVGSDLHHGHHGRATLLAGSRPHQRGSGLRAQVAQPRGESLAGHHIWNAKVIGDFNRFERAEWSRRRER